MGTVILTEKSTEEWEQRLDDHVISATQTSSRVWKLWISGLLLVLAWAVFAYIYQWRHGLVATGMRDRISWGLYITAFVFFIGISHAGTLMSAILRVSKASWRSPITRIAEGITVVSLISGAIFIVIDMGRPDRVYQLFINGNWQSPLMWDLLAVTVYLTGSIIYLWVPMIPDMAFFRDNLEGQVGKTQMWVYEKLAIGWNNTVGQKSALGRAVTYLMLLIIPVAVSVHTVVSWIFAMTVRVSWNSTIFGVFFVAGAIYSGVATLVIVLYVFRRIYHLEEYLTPTHFKYLAYLLATMAMIMIYGNLSEFITKGFKITGSEKFAFRQLFVESLAPLYWFYIFGGLILPILIIAFRPTRNIIGFVVASVFIDIGMFFERYFIVVGGLRTPTMPYDPSNYFPTWVEWSILAGGFALFLLLLTLFGKFLPIVANWEMKEERQENLEAETEMFEQHLALHNRELEAVK